MVRDTARRVLIDGPVALFLLVSCRQHRTLDATPMESKVPARLPPGVVEAWFDLDTGGDQGHFPPVDAGLVLHVEAGTSHFRQRFASCKAAGKGGALGDDDPASLDWAECDGQLFVLSKNADRIEVRASSGKLFAQVPVPKGSHAKRQE